MKARYLQGEIRGRVVSVDATRDSAIIVSGPNTKRVSLAAGTSSELAPGDWVALCPHAERNATTPALYAVSQRMASPGSSEPFPPLRSDWTRFHGDRASLFRAVQHRARINRVIRETLDDRGFLEVETPSLASSPGLETHLEAVEAHLRPSPAPDIERRWLVTSPEYHMKRLLCAGFERIYQLGRVWRSSETGPRHNPEFTMLEWYRAWETWRSLTSDIEALLESASRELGDAIRAEAHDAIQAQWLWLPFAEAIERYAGFAAWPWDDPPGLWARARAAGIGVDARDRDDAAAVFNRAVVERIDDALPRDRIVVLHDYPDCMASLARRSEIDPRVVERFEIYMGSVELANGFTELTDPHEQEARFAAELAERTRLGLALYPIDERFLSALRAGCPPAAGVALGVDRLLMFLLGRHDIRDVLAFPVDLA